MDAPCMVINFWEVLLWLGWQQQATTNIMQIVQPGKKKSPKSFFSSVEEN